MAVQINVAANQAALVQSIQAGVQAYNQRFANQNQINLQVNARGFSQPLGRITGDVKDFEAALAASNARVIAFGASTAVLGGVIRGFRSVAEITIDVEKNLTDLNRVFGLSTQSLQKFSTALFDVSKQTASSFSDASKAALEFSRQGLKAEEVIQRTTDALTLSRLAGLSVANSIEALTATVNGFKDTGITTTEVLNKLVAVEQSYAVSAGDLAEALSRTGLAAQDAGVNIDQLNALVTAAQEKTARGGAVIGNALKTIFTRIQSKDTLDALESYNVLVRDVQGNTLPAVQILQNFAKAYKDLADTQKNQLSTQVAGVYQVNILKALLSDLSSAQGAYTGALQKGQKASNEAQIATAQLNQSLDALLSQTTTVAQQFANNVGKITFEPLAKSATQTAKSIFETFNETLEGDGIGGIFARGFLNGIRNILAGPGAIGAFFVLFKLIQNSFTYLTQALPQIVGITTESQKRKNIEEAIFKILQQQGPISQALLGNMGNQAAQAQIILGIAKQQTAEYETQKRIAKDLAPQLSRQGVIVAAGGTGGLRSTRSSGFLPRFEEMQARGRGASAGVKAVPGVGKIGGRSFVANNQEYQIPNFAGTGETAVIPTYGGGVEKAIKMISSGKGGSILSGGFLPNFAKTTYFDKKTDKKGNQILELNRKTPLTLPKNDEFSPIVDTGLDTVNHLRYKIILSGSYSNIEDKFKATLDSSNNESIQKFLRKYTDLDANQINEFIKNYRSSKLPTIDDNTSQGGNLLVKPFKKNKKERISFKKQFLGVKSDAMGTMYEEELINKHGLIAANKQNSDLDFINAEAKVGKYGGAELIAKAIRDKAVKQGLQRPFFKGSEKRPRSKDDIDLDNRIINLYTTNAAGGYIPNFADADLPKEVEDILIAGKLEDYRIQGTSKYKFPSGKELYKSQVDNIAKRARKGTAGQAGKLRYSGGYNYESKPLPTPNGKQMIDKEYENFVQSMIPGLKTAHHDSVNFSLPFSLGPDSYIDFFNESTKTFYEAKGGGFSKSEVANKFVNAKTDLNNQLNAQLQKWNNVLVYNPDFASKGFIPNFGKINPQLLRDMIRLNNINVTPEILAQNEKTQFSRFRRYGNINVFRGVEGMSDRWRKLAEQYGLDHIFDNTKRGVNAVKSELLLDRVRKMVFSPRKARIGSAIGTGKTIKNEQELSDLTNLQKKNFAKDEEVNLKMILKTYQEFFNQSNTVSKRYAPFVSSSFNPDVPRWFGKLVSDKKISVSRILNKKTIEELNAKYGEMEVREAILALSKWGGGRGIGFDMNSIVNNAAFSKEKEIALLSSGFIPNFATNKKLNKNLLRDIIKLNLHYSDDYAPTRGGLGSKIQLHRGVKGKGKRWEDLKNKHRYNLASKLQIYKGAKGVGKLFGDLKTRNFENSLMPQKEIQKTVFDPRPVSNVEDLKNEFLDKNIVDSVISHQNYESKLPFVSTSISEQVAREKFAKTEGFLGSTEGIVASKEFKQSRIFTNTALQKLYNKYGKQEVKEAVLALSKLGGGKGVGFDVRSFSDRMKNEKEIALLSGGFVPNFAIRKGIRSSDLQYIRHLGGSTGADLVKDKLTSQLLVQKRGASAAHIINEARANKLYSALGIKVPDSQLIKEGSDLSQLTEYIEGKPLSTALNENVKSQLKERFAAISLMGDWDALGLSLDNVVVDKNGVPYQIDSGGALGFRAQGAPKGERFGAHVGELNTLRDRKRLAGSIFGSLSDEEIRGQIKKLLQKRSVITKSGGKYRSILGSRMDNMSKFFKGFIPNLASGYVKDVMNLESNMSGNRAILDTTSGPFPFIRNTGQSNYKKALADHGGLKNALNDSYRNQVAAGLMNKGAIPNFASFKRRRVYQTQLSQEDVAPGMKLTPGGKYATYLKEMNSALKELTNSLTLTDKQIKELKNKVQKNAAEFDKVTGSTAAVDSSQKALDRAIRLNRRKYEEKIEERGQRRYGGGTLAEKVGGSVGGVSGRRIGRAFDQRISGITNNIGVQFAAPILAGIAEEAITKGRDRSQLSGFERFASTGVSSITTGITTGAAIGSVIPGIGTAAGAATGALIGFATALLSVRSTLTDYQKQQSEFAAQTQQTSSAFDRYIALAADLPKKGVDSAERNKTLYLMSEAMSQIKDTQLVKVLQSLSSSTSVTQIKAANEKYYGEKLSVSNLKTIITKQKEFETQTNKIRSQQFAKSGYEVDENLGLQISPFGARIVTNYNFNSEAQANLQSSFADFNDFFEVIKKQFPKKEDAESFAASYQSVIEEGGSIGPNIKKLGTKFNITDQLTQEFITLAEDLRRNNEPRVKIFKDTILTQVKKLYDNITRGVKVASDQVGEANLTKELQRKILENLKTTRETSQALQTLDYEAGIRAIYTKQKGGLIKAQSGILVPGFSTGDKIPALLESGEVVINRNAANAYGVDNLLNLNDSVPRFGGIKKQKGGLIGSVFGYQSGGSVQNLSGKPPELASIFQQFANQLKQLESSNYKVATEFLTPLEKVLLQINQNTADTNDKLTRQFITDREGARKDFGNKLLQALGGTQTSQNKVQTELINKMKKLQTPEEMSAFLKNLQPAITDTAAAQTYGFAAFDQKSLDNLSQEMIGLIEKFDDMSREFSNTKKLLSESIKVEELRGRTLQKLTILEKAYSDALFKSNLELSKSSLALDLKTLTEEAKYQLPNYGFGRSSLDITQQKNTEVRSRKQEELRIKRAGLNQDVVLGFDKGVKTYQIQLQQAYDKNSMFLENQSDQLAKNYIDSLAGMINNNPSNIGYNNQWELSDLSAALGDQMFVSGPSANLTTESSSRLTQFLTGGRIPEKANTSFLQLEQLRKSVAEARKIELPTSLANVDEMNRYIETLVQLRSTLTDINDPQENLRKQLDSTVKLVQARIDDEKTSLETLRQNELVSTSNAQVQDKINKAYTERIKLVLQVLDAEKRVADQLEIESQKLDILESRPENFYGLGIGGKAQRQIETNRQRLGIRQQQTTLQSLSQVRNITGSISEYQAGLQNTMGPLLPDAGKAFQELNNLNLNPLDIKTVEDANQLANSLAAAREKLNQSSEDAKKLAAFEEQIRKILNDNTSELDKQTKLQNLLNDKVRQEAADRVSMKEGFRSGFDRLNDEADTIGRRLGEEVPILFRDGMTNALMEVAKGTSTIGDAFRDMAINIGQNIMQMGIQAAIGKGISSLGLSLPMFQQKGGYIGKQKGGIIMAEDGAYIPGNRTGDRNLAMLEDGEYVLNRQAVSALGVGTLDQLNYGHFPRFQSGGRFAIEQEYALKDSENQLTSNLLEAGNAVAKPIDMQDYTSMAYSEDQYFIKMREKAVQDFNESVVRRKQNEAKNAKLISSIVGAVGTIALGAGIGGIAAGAGGGAAGASGAVGGGAAGGGAAAGSVTGSVVSSTATTGAVSGAASGTASGAANASASSLSAATTGALKSAAPIAASSSVEVIKGGLTSLDQNLAKQVAENATTMSSRQFAYFVAKNSDNLILDGIPLASLAKSYNLGSLKGLTGTLKLQELFNRSGYFAQNSRGASILGNIFSSSLNSGSSIFGAMRRQTGGLVGYQSGGFIPYGSRVSDTVSKYMSGGSVINSPLVKRMSGNSISMVQSGGEHMSSKDIYNQNQSNSTNISINVGSDNKTTVGASSSSYKPNEIAFSKQMAAKVDQQVKQILAAEKRIGGILSK